MNNKIKAKYGTIVVSEDENGAVNITFNSDYNIISEMKKSNSITFHCVEPRNNIIKTIKNLKEYK